MAKTRTKQAMVFAVLIDGEALHCIRQEESNAHNEVATFSESNAGHVAQVVRARLTYYPDKIVAE